VIKHQSPSHPEILIPGRIIFRAFQGIGASGIYSMVMVIAPDMVLPEKHGKYMGIVSTVFIVASVLGPVLGGVINTHSSWRWVFLFKYADCNCWDLTV
jgi:MFS family permease